MLKITQDDIQKMEKIGKSQRGDIFHVLTKGGFNMIVSKNAAGSLEVLGTGPHPYVARHNAESLQKDIEWDESLMKSESPLFKNPNPPQAPAPIVSSDSNHYKMAILHSRYAAAYQKKDQMDFNQKHDDTMRYLDYTNTAVKHYKMAGLSDNEAWKEHEKNLQLGHTSEKPMWDERELDKAWRLKNPNMKPPTGLNYNFTK